jgi:hypothetical protein
VTKAEGSSSASLVDPRNPGISPQRHRDTEDDPSIWTSSLGIGRKKAQNGAKRIFGTIRSAFCVFCASLRPSPKFGFSPRLGASVVKFRRLVSVAEFIEKRIPSGRLD